MNTRKIVITGGPSTGKTTVISHLEQLGKKCLHEISRKIIQESQQQGISQLFLENPTLFSEKLLEGRIQQFMDAEKEGNQKIFMDRGIPDVIAYMDYIHQKNPDEFYKIARKYTYDQVFIFPPWKEIHVSDNERYESFEQAQKIYDHLLDTYTSFGYNCIQVPFGTVEVRTDFILKHMRAS